MTAISVRSRKLISLNILRAFTENVGDEYCLEDNLNDIKIQIKNKGISHIIIDDIQNLIGSDQRNWFFIILLNLANETGVKFILSGTDIPDFDNSFSSRVTIKKYAI